MKKTKEFKERFGRKEKRKKWNKKICTNSKSGEELKKIDIKVFLIIHEY